MHVSSPPDTMTPAERAREVAAILAGGYRRLLAKRAAEERSRPGRRVQPATAEPDPIRLGNAEG